MKRFSIIVLMLSLITLVSCDNNKNVTMDEDPEKIGVAADETASKSGEQVEAATGIPIYLNKSAYVSRVHDFENNPEWAFLGDKPVIIDFYADWCGPCKMVAPILEQLAAEYDGQIEILKVNTDYEQEIARFYNIRGIPAFFIVDAKGQKSEVVGYRDKAFFEQRIQEMLAAN